MQKKIVYLGDDFEEKQTKMIEDGWEMQGQPHSVHNISYAVFVKKNSDVHESNSLVSQ